MTVSNNLLASSLCNKKLKDVLTEDNEKDKYYALRNLVPLVNLKKQKNTYGGVIILNLFIFYKTQQYC